MKWIVKKKGIEYFEAWKKTTLIEYEVLKFSGLGTSPPSSVDRAQVP